jgi:flagellum-specific peptidoglycan hydrolase FlgJ
MFYKYCSKSLCYHKIPNKALLLLILSFFVVVTTAYTLGRFTTKDQIVKTLTPEEVMIVINKNEKPFHQDSLVNLLTELNVKYPHIVMAQSIVETGHWTSKIFNENHNLFGMKEAAVRVHTAKGTQYGHAYYQNWRESVYDYAFYQCRYLGGIRSEDEYYQYLAGSYAESPNYVQSLKRVVERENLRELFK